MTDTDRTAANGPSYGADTLTAEPPRDYYYVPPTPPSPATPAFDAAYRPDVPPRRRVPTALAGATALVVVALGAGAAGAEFATRRLDERAPAPAAPVTAAPATGNADNAPREQLAKVAAAVQPSVVSIAVAGPTGRGEGSGVILTSDGTILTNNHVAEGGVGGTVQVRFADGKTATATIVGRDAGSDLAVIKAQNVSGLTAATLGDDTALNVGDTVLALGSPLGLEGSVSAGIVSALHRPVALGRGSDTGSLGDAIQTDAPINPGNSGGALVDMNGHVIGINTAIATTGSGFGGQSGNIGVGFAIPITHAKVIADQLIRGEKPSQALLGVQASDATSGGALLGPVTPAGAAEAAGLRSGDIVTAIGKARIPDAASLTAAVRARRPGDKVEVTYTRNGEQAKATVTLGTSLS